MTLSHRDHTMVALYEGRQEAGNAVSQLHQSGFARSQIAIAGDDRRVREALAGSYDPGKAAKPGARDLGTLYGAGIGVLIGVVIGLILTPIAGLLAGGIAGIAGGVVGAVVGGVDGQVAYEDEQTQYREWLIEGKVPVIVHGSREEMQRAHALLQRTHPLLVRHYPFLWN